MINTIMNLFKTAFIVILVGICMMVIFYASYLIVPMLILSFVGLITYFVIKFKNNPF